MDDKQELPPRPTVPSKVRAFVDKWWETTANCPDQDAAVRASRECLKTLFPAEFDRTDRYRGSVPTELRSRKDDRRVRTNLIYRNVLQTVAMTVPDDHEVKWVPTDQVNQTEESPIDMAINRLSKTMKAVVEQYADETNFQEVAEGAVQDACQYRLAIIKCTFDRDFVEDSIRTHSEGNDKQENIEDLRVLVEDYRRNRFTKDDSKYLEMTDLMESIGIGDELELWKGLRTELVAIDCFRFDPCIRGYEQIYDSSWMAHDVMMSPEDIRAKFPFKLIKDENGADTTDWTGVHPDDLGTAQQNQRGGMSSAPTYYGNTLEKGKGPSARPDSPAEIARLMVREVWTKKLGRVFTMIDGIPYPVASWVPMKTPKQWYPFRVLRMNRVTGQVYGHSDVELQMDIQHRINRKRSDEEKARWLSLPRGIYNTQGIDQHEMNKMRDHNPGEWKGLNLGAAKSIKEVMEFQQFQFDPASFDTTNDKVELNMMAAQPSQMSGSTGSGDARFSSEVSAAMQGAAISSNARGTTIRKWLEGTYELFAEILLQELEPEDAAEVAGPGAFWPHIYSQADVDKATQQMDQDVDMEMAQQQQAAQLQAQAMSTEAMQMGMPPPPPFMPMDDMTKDTARATAIAQKSMEQFGFPEPVSRETLFRRMHCKVTVALNTQADRAQRIQSMQTLGATLQMMAQAAGTMSQSLAATGQAVVFNPKPLIRAAKNLFNADEEVEEMFQLIPLAPPPMAPMPGGPQAGGQPGLPPPVAGASAPQDSKSDKTKAGPLDAPINSPNSAVNPV